MINSTLTRIFEPQQCFTNQKLGCENALFILHLNGCCEFEVGQLY